VVAPILDFHTPAYNSLLSLEAAKNLAEELAAALERDVLDQLMVFCLSQKT